MERFCIQYVCILVFLLYINILINESHFHLAFGFCEYVDPETGLRAIRLLHDLSFGEKNLVVSCSLIILYFLHLG